MVQNPDLENLEADAINHEAQNHAVVILPALRQVVHIMAIPMELVYREDHLANALTLLGQEAVLRKGKEEFYARMISV